MVVRAGLEELGVRLPRHPGGGGRRSRGARWANSSTRRWWPASKPPARATRRPSSAGCCSTRRSSPPTSPGPRTSGSWWGSTSTILRTGVTAHSAMGPVWLGMMAFLQGHIELGHGLRRRRPPHGRTGAARSSAAAASSSAGPSAPAGGDPFESGQAASQEAFSLCHTRRRPRIRQLLLARGVHGRAHGRARLLRASSERCERMARLLPQVRAARIRSGQDPRRRRQALLGVQTPSRSTPRRIIARLRAAGDFTDVCESLDELARVETLFGDYAAAYAYAVRAEPYVDAGAAGTLLFNYLFWVHYAIAAARLGDRGRRPRRTQPPIWPRSTRSWRRCGPSPSFNPDNFASYYALAQAERARAGGDSDSAVGRLPADDRARRRARLRAARGVRQRAARPAFTGTAAIASPLAYFHEARALYSGVRRPREGDRTSKRRSRSCGRRPAGSQGLGLPCTPTTDRGSAHLDLGTALKASLAIAGEIALEQVVDRLVAISIENAGAERGVFVSVDGEDLRVEAEGVAGGDVRHHGSVPLDDQGDARAGRARAGGGPHRRGGRAARRPRAAHHPQGRSHRRALPREHAGVRGVHPRAAGASRGAVGADGHLARERPALRPPRGEGRRTDPGAV